MKINKPFLYSIATLIGVTIGAGIFVLPYGAVQSNLILTTFYLITLTGLTLLINFLYGEVILRTKEKHRLLGYIKLYLGKIYYFIILFMEIFMIIGTLLIYLLMAGEFLSIIFSNYFNYPSIFYSLISGIILTILIIFDLKTVVFFEFFMIIFLFFSIFIIFGSALPKIDFSNYVISNKNFFLPIGLILFALAGLNGITEIRDILRGQEKLFKKAIKWGTILPASLYFFFIITVAGVSGINTSKEAIQGLTPFLGEKIIFLGAVFGFLAIATSFLGLGLTFKNTLLFDFNFPPAAINAILIIIPFAIYFSDLKNFIKIIILVGGIPLIIEYITVILLHRQAKLQGDRQPEYQITF